MKIVTGVNSKWKKKVFQQFNVWILHLKGHIDHSLKIITWTAWTCVCVCFLFYNPNLSSGIRLLPYDLMTFHQQIMHNLSVKLLKYLPCISSIFGIEIVWNFAALQGTITLESVVRIGWNFEIHNISKIGGLFTEHTLL